MNVDPDIEFGDFEIDDALDTAPPAPEQVAARLHRYRRYLNRLAGGPDPGDFFDLSRREQDDALAVAERIIEWLATNGPVHRYRLAETIHNIRASEDPSLPEWDDLDDDLVDIADAIAAELADWLIRQGAWR